MKGATNAQKKEIDELSGLKRVSINRVYETGTISAKIAVAIAQTLSIDPFYLTGEVAEKGELTEEILNKFLEAKGYAELIVQGEKPARKTRKKAAAKEKATPATALVKPSAQQAAPVEAPVEVPAPAETPAKPPVTLKKASSKPSDYVDLEKMTEDELVQLIRALTLQARFSEGAQNKLNSIKALLVFE